MKVYRFPKGHAILNCGKTEDGTFCLVVSESDKERRIGGTYSDYDIGEKVDDLFAIAFEVPEQVDSWARTLRRIAKVMRFGGVQVRQIQGKDWTATDEQKRIIEALRSCWNIERTPKDCPFTVGEASCTVGCQIDRMREAADLIERMAIVIKAREARISMLKELIEKRRRVQHER